MINNHLQFSIIMPAYNASHTIEESIISVINQTYSSWELIIIDDASKDSTSEIVGKYLNKDPRIIYIRKDKNEGVASARNTGVSIAHFNWISFLDSDDLWDSSKLEKTVELIKRIPNGKLFFTGSKFINYEGIPSKFILHVPEKINYRELLCQNLISCSSVTVDKECLNKHKMVSGFIHEDYCTWLGILKTEKFAYGYDEPLLIYRLSKNSKSGNKFKAAIMNWNSYRTVGIGFFPRVYYMGKYIFRSIRKYSSI